MSDYEYAEFEDGLVVGPPPGDGRLDSEGNPWHSEGAGPHVIYQDGTYSWVRQWESEDGETGSLIEGPDGYLHYLHLDTGFDISDEGEVVFTGGDLPVDSMVETFSEEAVSDGWTRETWDNRFSEGWPTWEADVRASALATPEVLATMEAGE